MLINILDRWRVTFQLTCLVPYKLTWRVTCQIAGGVWADRLGGKKVLGFGVLWWSLATMLTPLAAQAGLPVLLAARACMGIGEVRMKTLDVQYIFLISRAAYDIKGTAKSAWVLFEVIKTKTF